MKYLIAAISGIGTMAMFALFLIKGEGMFNTLMLTASLNVVITVVCMFYHSEPEKEDVIRSVFTHRDFKPQ